MESDQSISAMDEFKKEQRTIMNTRREDEVNILGMIESRIMEIIQIESECKKKQPKLFQQRLPRYMRRRAASHKPSRLPKRLRPFLCKEVKVRKCLIRYRNRLRYRKHKRVLAKHKKHKYGSEYKCNLHKWFAKRFKMATKQIGKEQLVYPLYNNTKNQRNLRRQSIYSCAYLAYAHFTTFKLSLCPGGCKQEKRIFSQQIRLLSQMTDRTAGFTFEAKSLNKLDYELAIHLYRPNTEPKEFICTSLVHREDISEKKRKHRYMYITVPVESEVEIEQLLNKISSECITPFKLIEILRPSAQTRVRLIGPHARTEAMRIAHWRTPHEAIVKRVDENLHNSLGVSMGAIIIEHAANFVYYRTNPQAVDITFKMDTGRMRWSKLIRNKAHLVGGYRDIDRVLTKDCFKLRPDNEEKV